MTLQLTEDLHHLFSGQGIFFPDRYGRGDMVQTVGKKLHEGVPALEKVLGVQKNPDTHESEKSEQVSRHDQDHRLSSAHLEAPPKQEKTRVDHQHQERSQDFGVRQGQPVPNLKGLDRAQTQPCEPKKETKTDIKDRKLVQGVQSRQSVAPTLDLVLFELPLLDPKSHTYSKT